MFKLRNLTAVVIALIAVLALMIPFVSAQPALQTTETPVASDTPGATTTAVASDTPAATAMATETSVATAAATTTVEATTTAVATSTTEATAVAPAVSPASTRVGTPSTLPQTGESDGSTAALALVVLAVGALIVVGAIGLARASRRAE